MEVDVTKSRVEVTSPSHGWATAVCQSPACQQEVRLLRQFAAWVTEQWWRRGDEISLDNRISLVKYYARCSAFCHQWQLMKIFRSIQPYRYPQKGWFSESSATCRYYFGFFFSFLSCRWFLDRWVG